MTTGYTCRVCGHDGNTQIYTMREGMFGLSETFQYFQCLQCGCLQITDIPADMQRYYPNGYYSFGSSLRETGPGALIRYLRAQRSYHSVIPRGFVGRFLSRMFPNRKLNCLAHANLSLDSRILDIGCGSGWRLYALREAGFINVLGIDPYLEKEEIIHSNGVRILKKDIESMEGEWDLIMFHHSFEHLADPTASLRKAASLLRKNGACLIRVPNVDSFAWDNYRENWYQIDAPRHFYLYSRKSIDVLAEKAGFWVSKILFDSTMDQFWKSARPEHGQRGPMRPRWRERYRLKRKADELNREGRGDQAVYYLSKT